MVHFRQLWVYTQVENLCHCIPVINLVAAAVFALLPILSLGCASQSERVSPDAVWHIRGGRYLSARDELRRYSVERDSPDIILDNMRLAVAALHDGAFYESQQALHRVYPYLVTGTVNSENRQNAATFEYEGRKVWKGEPFEQAMMWYYQGLTQMIAGDWENAAAASRNMLFTLVDFAGTQTINEAMNRAESPEWFDEHADEVESDLVLGYLMEGIAQRFQNRQSSADARFDRARELAPELGDLIDRLAHGDYNTLIFIEAMPGPRKEPQGTYGETFVYEPTPIPGQTPDALLVTDENGRIVNPDDLPKRMDAVDTWKLAQHPRWWSLRSLRETKKAIGEVLTLAGTGAVIYGTQTNDANSAGKAIGAGLLAVVAGQALAASSSADLRAFDVLPRAVYIVPLNLEPGRHTLRFSLPDQYLDAIRHDLMPGLDTPAVYTVRLESTMYQDESAVEIIHQPIVHPNDHTGPIVGEKPYILGGNCLCTPTWETLDAYQAGGFLTEYTLEDLLDMYRQEGIVFTPLPLSQENVQTWRHVLDGGRLLYTPLPGSAGYERLTYGGYRGN